MIWLYVSSLLPHYISGIACIYSIQEVQKNAIFHFWYHTQNDAASSQLCATPLSRTQVSFDGCTWVDIVFESLSMFTSSDQINAWRYHSDRFFRRI